MSVQALNEIHRLYIELSQRFKSAWTYHQFLQGLQKILMEESLAQYTSEFQSLYASLKGISAAMNASEAEKCRSQIESCENRLNGLFVHLIDEDEKVSPELLRVFFQRVKNYDDNILTQLLKFYLFSGHLGAQLEPDRLDKIDFIVTKLAEEEQAPGGPYALRNRAQSRQIFQGLWPLVQYDAFEKDVSTVIDRLDEVRFTVGQVETFDELIQKDLIKAYRGFKHEMGKLYFEPDVLLGVVETNLVFKNKIRLLHRREERQIVSEYQQIFELQQQVPVDMQLDQELSRFQDHVERFEKDLQAESLSVEDLAELKSQVRSLIPRLTAGRGVSQPSTKGTEQPFKFDDLPDEPASSSSLSRADDGWGSEHVKDHYRELVQALEASNGSASPKSVTLSPEVFALRLEPREVVAYRRLSRSVECDETLEAFLLKAAALRMRILEEVQEINGILDDTAITRDAPVFARARGSLALADLFERRMAHSIQQTAMAGDGEEMRQLQVVRMRLLRELSGLWLLCYKTI